MRRVHSLGTYRARWSPIAALAVLALASFLPACKSKARQGMDEHGHVTLESVGKELSVTFPAGTRLIGVYREERGMGDMIEAKVEIPAAHWPGFLASTPLDPNEFRPGTRGFLGPDNGFWDPRKAKNLRTAQVDLPNGRALNIGYDDSRRNVIVVYLVNFGG